MVLNFVHYLLWILTNFLKNAFISTYTIKSIHTFKYFVTVCYAYDIGYWCAVAKFTHFKHWFVGKHRDINS